MFSETGKRLSESCSELYHYTRLEAVRGIVGNQAIWASHYSQLNDKEEVEHSRKIWIEELVGPLLDELQKLAKGSLKLRREIAMKGGIIKASQQEAVRFVNAFFATSFMGGKSGVPFAAPFIASFCSHHNSGEYTKENGLLSQWRAYGGTDSYAIVFYTLEVETLLALEAARGWYSFWQVERVIYNTSDEQAREAIRRVMSPMIDAWRAGKLNADSFDIGDIIYDFLKITTIVKHQGFREENEIRVVVCPYTDALAQLVMSKTGKKIDLTYGIKRVHTQQRGASVRRYVSLFEALDKPLPIKRIIVGPSTDQDRSVRHIREVVGESYEIVISKTPYLPVS